MTQPADGAYLLVRMEREGHPNLEEARQLLGWNGGGANSELREGVSKPQAARAFSLRACPPAP